MLFKKKLIILIYIIIYDFKIIFIKKNNYFLVPEELSGIGENANQLFLIIAFLANIILFIPWTKLFYNV